MKSQRLTALALTGLLAAALTGCSTATPGSPIPAASEAGTDASASIAATGWSDKLAAARDKAREALKKLSDKIGTPSAPVTPGVAAPESLAALATLPIKGRAPKTGYSRDQFGPSWSDTDRNGCDQRNDILARDLTGETLEPNKCVVLTGTLADKYTGKTINFVRGNKTSTLVQIDHMVALSDAWQKGAQKLTAEERKQLANDPLNLMAADGPANGQKSDSDTSGWLPSNKSFRCEYVSRQIAVKAKYKLWVTQAEHDAMAGVLTSCPA
jgi:hypothetical protein